MTKTLDVLSLGMGVQSTAIYFMSALGELPPLDVAIFADTGREKTGTMQYLDFLLDWREKNGGPEIIVRAKSLYQDLLRQKYEPGERFASIPAFSAGGGMLRRQCTREYKIETVDRAIREILGLKFRQRNVPTNIWKGISADEAIRMAIPEDKWKTFIYPFVGYGVPGRGKWFKLTGDTHKPMARTDIKGWYKAHGLPIPPKSACVFCPYHSDASWADMKRNSPDDFLDAVKVDHAIRNGSSNNSLKNEIFLHRSLKPLDEVNFDPNDQIEFGECSGNCHI